MIKRFLNYIWNFLVEMGEAKQARMKRNGYSMWY